MLLSSMSTKLKCKCLFFWHVILSWYVITVIWCINTPLRESSLGVHINKIKDILISMNTIK